MANMRRRTVHLGAVDLAVSLDERLDRSLRESVAYRYVLKPALTRIRQSRNGFSAGRSPRTVASPSPPPPGDANRDDLWKRVSALPWYHTIDLGNEVITPGFVDHRPHVDYYGLPEDMSGMRCLDLGTFDGFWAFEMERRGAEAVVALDLDDPLQFDVPDRFKAAWKRTVRAQRSVPMDAGFQLAHAALNSRVKRQLLNLYDLAPEKVGQFDLVFISDVLVHLRDIVTILEQMRTVTRGVAIVAEGFDPELDREEKNISEFVGEPYPYPFMWWLHGSRTWAKIMNVAGFQPVETVSKFKAISRDGPFWKVVLKGRVDELQTHKVAGPPGGGK
jgi:Methyltransferase domain